MHTTRCSLYGHTSTDLESIYLLYTLQGHALDRSSARGVRCMNNNIPTIYMVASNKKDGRLLSRSVTLVVFLASSRMGGMRRARLPQPQVHGA